MITSNHNVLYIVEQHKSHNVVHLYIVSFEEGIVDEDEDGGRIDLNDPCWRDKISDDEDLFDVDVDDIDGGARPSKTKPNRSKIAKSPEGEQDRDERGDDDRRD